MVKLLIPFLPVLIRSRHIVADQIVGVIIEHIQILRALGMLETPLEIPLQVIDKYLLVRSTIDKHLVFFLIQDDPVDKSILLGSLSLPIDFPDRLACLSVKNEDIAIVEQIRHQHEPLSYRLDTTLGDKLVVRFQRDVFHIQKVLNNPFLFRIIGFYIKSHKCLDRFLLLTAEYSHER